MTDTLTPGTDRTEENNSVQTFSPFEGHPTQESGNEHGEASEETRLPSESPSDWEEIPSGSLLVTSLEEDIRSSFDELCEEHDEFLSIDRQFFIKKCMDLFTELSEEELENLTYVELKNRIEKIGWVEITSGMLSDLSDEEREKYERAKQRRPLFS